MKTLLHTFKALVFCLIIMSCHLANAQNWNEIINATASDAAAANKFGFAVDIDGDYAIVGAPFDDENGSDSGAAYIFVRSGNIWIEQTKLIANSNTADDQFGFSVAISGDYAIVGARHDSNGYYRRGGAYIFIRTGSSWSQQSYLLNGNIYDVFGWSVDIDGDDVIVGARGENGGGAAYTYVRSGSNWVFQSKLEGSDTTSDDWFGSSVALSGDYAIVGARNNDDAGSNSGSAYIFVRSGTTWSEQTKLTASDADTSDRFGYAVDISGNYAIVGAWANDDAGSDSGSAYIFERSGSTWSELIKLTASDAAANDNFGDSVALTGDYAIVGADFNDDSGSDSGSTYIFVRSGSIWSQQSRLTASDAQAGDHFGNSVAISGNDVIVGATLDNDIASDQGSAYFYNLSCEDGDTTFYADSDGDGFGNPLNSVVDCSQPEGYVENNTDCDDNDENINPETIWYADLDNDGYGDLNTSLVQCEQPENYVLDNTDCNDNSEITFPNAEEICDGIDNDCDGLVDDDDPDITGQFTWYTDLDNDGFGDINNSVLSCNQPTGYIEDNTDCDDTNNIIFPGAEEICDSFDNDCNGLIDDIISTSGGQITSLMLPTDPIDISQQINGIAIFENFDVDSATWDWGDGQISNGVINSNEITGSHIYEDAGVYEVYLTLTNLCGEDIIDSHQYVVIYDPSSGFVTGGGWINSPPGAYITNPNLTGTANFGFVSKYKRGRNTPDGNTEFQFQAASLNFKSTDYEWLIVAGTKAMFKGSGTINNQGDYQFILSAKDQSSIEGGDTFRIKIWDSSTELVVYDNQLGDEDNADATTVLAGGSIIIHNNPGSHARIENVLSLTYWPNPSENSFDIKLKHNNNFEKTDIYVFDVLGNLIHQNKFDAEFTYNFGKDLETGIYFVKVKQGNKQKLFKLIKH